MNVFVTPAEMAERREASRLRGLYLARMYALKKSGDPIQCATAYGYCGA